MENNTQYTAKVKQNKKSKKGKTVLSTRFQPVKSSGKTRTEFPHPTSWAIKALHNKLYDVIIFLFFNQYYSMHLYKIVDYSAINNSITNGCF